MGKMRPHRGRHREVQGRSYRFEWRRRIDQGVPAGQDESGTAIAFVSKYVETGSAGGGKGDFSATQISAEADESEKKEQLCVNRHKAEQEF